MLFRLKCSKKKKWLSYNPFTGEMKIYSIKKTIFKGIVHPKMKILSSFTHPQVVQNLYEFLYSAEHKRRYFEEHWEPNSSWPSLTSTVKKTTTMEQFESE